MQAHEYERLAMMTLSSIGIIEYNENGGPDVNSPSVALQGGATEQQGLTVEKLDGGSVRYFKAGSGSKIETIKNDRPGNAFMEFHERMTHSAFFGLNWSYAFWRGAGAGGGTAQRTEIATAQRAVEDRQDLLSYAAKRLIGYAVAKAQKIGRLSPSPDWHKFKFSFPAKLTIDDGRVAKELESSVKLGFRNQSDVIEMMGGDPTEMWEERAREVYERKVAARRWSIDGIIVEDREMVMITPNESAAVAVEAAEGGEPNENDNEKLKFESLKAKFDAYGVAVRAGAITPAKEDEIDFRKEAGLPSMPQAVTGAWEEDEGFRRPITLLSKAEADAGFDAPAPKTDDPPEE